MGRDALPPEAIDAAIDELTRDRSAMLLEQANREVYRLLKKGIPVSVPNKELGGQVTLRVRVIDWAHPADNDRLERHRQPKTAKELLRFVHDELRWLRI